MTKRGLTQLSVYDYIYSREVGGDTSPTVREICSALGLASTSTVHTHLKKLRDGGYISYDRNQRRTIRLTDKVPEGSMAYIHGNTKSQSQRVNAIPLVGKVAAGQPVYAFDDIQATYLIPKELLHGSMPCDTYILTVDGDSMIDAGILTGDLIIVSRSIEVRDGDIVVARIEGDVATVKRLYRENGCVRLQPENAAMSPIFVSTEAVEIVGRVIGLMRSY